MTPHNLVSPKSEGFKNRGIQGEVICSACALTLNMFICFPKTFLFPKREHHRILKILQERVVNFWVDGGCKLHYISERDMLITTEIKQHLIKAKENLALSLSCVKDKSCLHVVLRLLFYCMQVSFYYWCHLINFRVSLTWVG